MIRKMRIPAYSVLAVALAIGSATLALSETPASGPIQTRQKAMEGIGDAMKSLSGIARKEAPFDAAVVRKDAESIVANLEIARKAFPAGSEKGDAKTWAKASIWSDGAGFAAAMKTSHEAATAMAAVKEEAAFGPALKALGGSCKGCHETYRLPKN